MVEWASGPPPKQPANPLWSGRVREGGVNLGVTGQDGCPDNESTPDTRQHPPHPHQPQRHPPKGENQRCQPWESRKPPGPTLALRRSQASSRNIQSRRCSAPSLSDASSVVHSTQRAGPHAESSVFSHWWRIQLCMHACRCKPAR